MGVWTVAPALKDDEHDGADHGNEVEREVHQVANHCFRGELGERLARELAQTLDSIANGGRFDLAFFGDQSGMAALDEGGIECIDELR